jgi:hypothetical protein
MHNSNQIKKNSHFYLLWSAGGIGVLAKYVRLHKERSIAIHTQNIRDRKISLKVL